MQIIIYMLVGYVTSTLKYKSYGMIKFLTLHNFFYTAQGFSAQSDQSESFRCAVKFLSHQCLLAVHLQSPKTDFFFLFFIFFLCLCSEDYIKF